MFYPRTKIDGGGPGLKGIKREQGLGPSDYKIERNLVEKKSTDFKFQKTVNKNFFAQYISSKAYVPGMGKYKDIERGLALQTRPMSCPGRRRIT